MKSMNSMKSMQSMKSMNSMKSNEPALVDLLHA